MDAISLLTADHNRVRGLFTRFRDAHEEGDDVAMTDLAAQVTIELGVHTTIEEEVFYPAVRRLDSGLSEEVDEGLQEHHVVDTLLGELADTQACSPEWIAKMTVIMENVEHHAEEEETDLFPALRRDHPGAMAEIVADLEACKEGLGAPTLADKISLTRDQLMDMAREQAIPGRSTMTQEELAATVSQQ